MKGWNIAQRLVAAFAATVSLVVAAGILSLFDITSIKRTAAYMSAEPYPGLIAIHEIEVQMMRDFGRAQKYLIAPADERAGIAADITNSKKDIDAAFRDYEARITSPDDKAMFEALAAHRDEFSSTFDEINQLCVSGHNDEAVANANKSLIPMIARITDEDLRPLVQYNRGNAEKALSNINASVRAGFNGVSIAVILNVLATCTIAWLLLHSINRILKRISAEMNEGAQQVASAANQVSSASQVLAQGASEQAASLEETTSSLEVMASMTKRNSESSQNANELARQARAATDKGASDMEAMSNAMKAIKAGSDDIAKIIKTIDEIAFQTNILALNAAVEAARAGEAGMGFAVVADEVRNLAQRCAQAAKETTSKIEGAISKSEQGVEISTKVSGTLNEILTKVRRVDELVSEVAGASREQTEEISQINTAVGRMDKVTQSNAANAEESAAAAEELNAQAKRMQASIGELLALVSQSRGDSGSDSQRAKEPPAAVRAPRNGRTVRTEPGRPPSPHSNGKGPADAAPAPAGLAARRGEIPMDGDFKDF